MDQLILRESRLCRGSARPLIIQGTKEEIRRCRAPDPEHQDKGTVHGVVFQIFSSTRYFRKTSGSGSRRALWTVWRHDTTMAARVFPRLDHRFGVDGRVG